MAKDNHTVVLSCLLFWWCILILASLCNAGVPAIYVLGDSTADVGTNSYLAGSQARADFPHNGVDFPHSRPTGRFSNGFNSADFLAKLMGFKRSPPPYLFLLSLKSRLGKHLLKGANFASGGSGLLDITGSMLKVVTLSEQIKQFGAVRDDLSSIMGPASTQTMLSQSLFFVSTGSNDIFGYFVTNSTMSKDDFVSQLMIAYANHIKTLYNLGARKFGIISVPPIGCCPSQRLLNTTGGCFEPMNDFATTFYSKLATLLCKLSSELEGMKYSLGNAYEMSINVIQNPSPFKLKNVDTACCGYGKLNAEMFCNATSNLCADRSEYLFWDMYHPTQAAARLAAETLYGGPPLYVSPINFSQLAA